MLQNIDMGTETGGYFPKWKVLIPGPQGSVLGSRVQQFMLHLEVRAAGSEIPSFSCENEFIQVSYKWNQLQKDLGSGYKYVT